MKKLKIKKLTIQKNSPLALISKELDQLAKNQLDTINWQEYSYKPEVKFAIGYNATELFLKFYVTEDSVRAVNSESNQPVYQDSCVEFFVSPVTDGPYVNFEFNAIGTCLMQKGMDRASRKFIDPEDIAKIRRESSLGRETFDHKPGRQSWNLVIAIPFILLFDQPEPELSGRIIRSNFYKCGDKMDQRHYLSWNSIGTESPDFHRPEFFGVAEFE
jgi:hypothetical protein